ncbi:hypothetical protein [Streptomyces sp. NBC_01428]|uniref:hypothetical protein n=1 Tax=Streptomyces sp. NBC_01428 TaxID=2903861 RepID=UPI002E303072|nr:hypothetical protein [Streptomyces sp. NBC_01428]
MGRHHRRVRRHVQRPSASADRPGSGPALALPRPAADGASHAYAASDNGSVGGDAADVLGDAKPVVWTCALKQAYVPAR